jgi:hypothetical protein
MPKLDCRFCEEFAAVNRWREKTLTRECRMLQTGVWFSSVLALRCNPASLARFMALPRKRAA